MSAAARSRRATRAMRPWDWAFPSRPVSHREVVSALPTDDGVVRAGPAGQPAVDARDGVGRPPLLMVHGVAHAAWCFEENWLPAAAAAGWPSYALSLRGHGGSAGGRHLRRTLVRDYVHDVMQTITELPEPPVLIGHSMGAIVAQLVAERYPLRGLVLLTPAPLHSGIGDLLAIAKDRPADALGAVVGRTLSMEPELLFEGLDPVTARRYSDRTQTESPLVQYELLLPRTVGPIRCPVLVVGAPSDRLVRPADVQRTAEQYGVEPVWFPGMGHDVMLDAGWQRVLDAVLEFAADLPAWGHAPTR